MTSAGATGSRRRPRLTVVLYAVLLCAIGWIATFPVSLAA